MPTLSPTEIAAAIYWCGAQFGPSMAPNATQNAQGQIVTHIPPPGSPERTRLENWLDTAIAIALAESGGNTNAKNASSTASGLWQILVSEHGPEIQDAETFWATNRSNGKTPGIFDPLVNTFVAARIYQQSNWTPWETYTSGAYKKYRGHGKAAYAYLTSTENLKKAKKNFLSNMQDDKTLVNNIQAFVPGAGLIKGVDNVGSWLAPILKFITQGALAVGVFVLGAILVILGIWAIASRTRGGKTVKAAVKTVIP